MNHYLAHIRNTSDQATDNAQYGLSDEYRTCKSTDRHRDTVCSPDVIKNHVVKYWTADCSSRRGAKTQPTTPKYSLCRWLTFPTSIWPPDFITWLRVMYRISNLRHYLAHIRSYTPDCSSSRRAMLSLTTPKWSEVDLLFPIPIWHLVITTWTKVASRVSDDLQASLYSSLRSRLWITQKRYAEFVDAEILARMRNYFSNIDLTSWSHFLT